ncbi:sulfite exporter TauE/SafE family protein [Idiomarina tyrosinivorans]|uniref:Probable membrane transporter protein n=1 Tax=Idiomarina tyrosinivorans TaxID=1445662 RepID=A0A432ZLP2_9GAMM|nr:sulfite exporter TauE/SafE family protein [Idiomarina tyrosinivorans]RUO78896.1 sulfite exporter TauE/SafE family protein [Idiomarina tyrosinivorans]
MWLAFLGAIVIGISLGLFGSGGSILTLPVLLYGLQVPAKLAIAASLLVVGAISVINATPRALNKTIPWRHVGLFGGSSMLGSYLGAWMGSLVSSQWQLIVFALLMFSAAFSMWKRQRADSGRRPATLLLLTSGFCVGVVTGFVGVGGGFLIVPALVTLGTLSLVQAVSASLVIITLQASVGFVQYWIQLDLTWQRLPLTALAVLIVAGALGSFVGQRLAQRLPAATLRRIFAVFLWGMAAFVIWQQLRGG